MEPNVFVPATCTSSVTTHADAKQLSLTVKLNKIPLTKWIHSKNDETKKLFVKVDSFVDILFSCPGIIASICQSKVLNDVENLLNNCIVETQTFQTLSFLIGAATKPSALVLKQSPKPKKRKAGPF